MYIPKYCSMDSLTHIILENLYEKSIKTYFNDVEKESDCFERKRDLILIKKYITYLEDYLYALEELGYINKKTILLLKLSSLDSISVFSKNKRDNKSSFSENKIELNPILDETEIRLNLYRRVTEYLHSRWENDVRYYLHRNYSNDSHYFNKGFNLINKATSIDTAEELTHYIQREQRPVLEKRINDNIFSGTPYYSNFYIRGEIQEVADDFSKTYQNRNLKELSRISFNDDFVYSTISYYDTIPLKRNLDDMIICMGKIDEASDSLYNKIEVKKDTSLENLDTFKSKVSENKYLVKFKK